MNKKLIITFCSFVVLMTAVEGAYASGGHHRGHGRHHHRFHEADYYEPAPYYAPPPPVHYDRRSHQGLAGGVVGSVVGYELGNGHPLATGIGAAAGSFLGNEISGRR